MTALAPRPTMRIWTPDAAPANRWDDDTARELNVPPESLCTLRSYWHQEIEPELIRRIARGQLSERTRLDQRHALNAWSKWGGAYLRRCLQDSWHRTRFELVRPLQRLSEPPIGLITDDDLTDFVSAMEAEGLSPRSINKYLSAVSAMLRIAGRRVLLTTPQAARVGETETENWIPTAEQYSLFWATCESACWPNVRGLRAADWWRALLALLANYGLACGDWMRLDWLTSFCDDFATLRYCRHKTKRKRPHDSIWPLNDTTRHYLMKIRVPRLIALGELSVFCFAGAKCPRRFALQWRALMERAGLATTHRKTDGKEYLDFDRHSCRRFANQWYQDHGEREAGEYLLNHRLSNANKVNSRHYGLVYQPPKSVADAIRSIPQLPCLVSGLQ